MRAKVARVVKKEAAPRIVSVDVARDVPTPHLFPWKYKAGSVHELLCNNVLEYIPGKLRGEFMDEIYRILAPDGRAAITVPYWNHVRGVQDYRLEWPPVTEQSFLYFNRDWRIANQLKIDLRCDFDFTYGYTPEPDVASRNEESRSFHIKHYNNAVQALHLLLTKKPHD